MPSPIEAPGGDPKGGSKVTPETFALALLVASSLHIIENLLPRIPIFPWMRIGLSYAVILPFLLHFGPKAAFALFLARNGIAFLYGGQPLTTFLIGSASGFLALFGLGHPVAWAYRRGWLGLLGAGILLAAGFNLAQLVLVNMALIRHSGFYFQTGPILAWSLLSGTAVALLIRFSQAELAALFTPGAERAEQESAGREKADVRKFLAGCALLAVLFTVDAFAVQLPVLAALGILTRGGARMVFLAWPFFFYLAWLHLFRTPGQFLIGEWITREGVVQFSVHAARPANFILLGRWLAGHFPWQWAGNSRSPYLRGFLLSLPLLPALVESSLKSGKEMFRRIRAGRRQGLLAPAFETWRKRMDEASAEARDKPPER